MNFEKLKSLEDQLVLAQTVSECKNALAEFLELNGLTTFSYTYYTYHPLSASKLRYEMCSDNFLTWHTHYLEEHYNDIDSTLKFVYNNHLPIYWSLEQQLAQAKTLRERQMRLDSIAFGAESGLSIPLHGPQNNFAVLLLVKMKGEAINLSDLSLQYQLFVAAHQYYHYLENHLVQEMEEGESYNLTQRELQCLYLMAKQYSLPEIAQQLELTNRTINFHIQKLNKKLGTANKYQSLNKALALKLITV